MQISVDGVELFTLTETQKNIIKNDIPYDIFDADMKRRLQWVLVDEKVNRCLERLINEWVRNPCKDCEGNTYDSKLIANGVTSIPIDKMALAELIFAQTDPELPFVYKCRKTREDEAAQQGGQP